MIRQFTIVDAPQRSEAWFQARCGRVTGSVAADILSMGKKGGESVGRRDLRTRLMLERLTGVSHEDTWLNDAMRWGIAHEAEAFAAYEAVTGDIVQQTGFLSHTSIAAGCSLDGHVGDFARIIECKCPLKSAIHLENLQTGEVPSEYVRQIIHNLWLTGATECDFVSFDPRFDVERQTVIVRVAREAFDLTAYELALRTFLGEVDRELNKARLLRGGLRAA